MKSRSLPTSPDELPKSLLANYSSDDDRRRIQRAYELAERAHRGQTRSSGEPYITHCIAVANILADLHVPATVIAAALLHDTVEDTSVTLSDIRNEFDDTVSILVDGVTKLTAFPRVSHKRQHTKKENERTDDAEARFASPGDSHQRMRDLKASQSDLKSESLRKAFLFMRDDPRVALIKLADRLHNMRTLGFTSTEKQKRIAQETLDIFAPLANLLGVWQIKWELEDLSFRYLNPEKYKEIASQIQGKRPDREKQITEIIGKLTQTLKRNNIQAEISGRPKHIYSIYKKMTNKGKSFDHLRDVRAVRLIVQNEAACYAALGVIHMTWRPIREEFDDYIAAPKENRYQSLHTAVIYDDGRPLEVQIRTQEMHENAEHGIAAHWRYKGGAPHDKSYEKRIKQVRNRMEQLNEVQDAREFVEGMKSDVLQEYVTVYTPKGDMIELPVGSTPIDFAYRVHTDIGHFCRGARVNGKLVPLSHELKNFEQVEISTAKRTSKQGGPSRDWLNPNLGYVKTQRARSKIKAWFKKQQVEQNLSQGRADLERELQRLGLSDTNFEKLARELGYKTQEEMFIAIGYGDLTLKKVITQVGETEEATEIFKIAAPDPKKRDNAAVQVVGLKGLYWQLARCCSPTPGDPIIAYITRGRGASVHRQDCPNMLRRHDTERFLRVDWGVTEQLFPVSICVKAYDRGGLLKDISSLLENEGVNISGVKVSFDRSSIADLRLVVDVRNLEQLSRVLTRIENVQNVIEARRVTG
ncbi:MAG: bifunctional (p)ppGpp synthetase/guanosine-3',5'-bis(diphosphate) 3'-pyrophosphohydrolase [Anaerolineales bacterium]|nr:bifunctional (p)ppGpp synthetase/guanosine-3',5'-bis(diphosphate) 3'-pyrophosphohydrolase [Anaerolineales bacterium]